MCVQSQLIISLVGPYDLYGEQLIKYCIQEKTHYLDLTGEYNFVNRIINKYNQQAIDNNVLLINCCGFESIIPEIGSFLMVKKLQTSTKQVHLFMRSNGSISGGTWNSFLNALNKKIINSSSHKRASTESYKKIFYHQKLKKWAMIFPTIDRSIVMRTSQSNNSYGSNFSFRQYMLFNSLFKIFGIIFGVSLLKLFIKIPIINNLIYNLKPSGSGPSDSKRQQSWFKVDVIGSDEKEELEHLIIKGGDPGYEETAKFISESALCIIHDNNKLLKHKGFLTPIQCMGSLIINRLEFQGIIIE